MMVRIGARYRVGAGMLLAALALSGCENPLRGFGAAIPAPDEFQVLARAPIEVPADRTTLPEPSPGARSPLQPDPHAAAQAALLGSAGTRSAAPARSGAGEAALLAATGGAGASSDIRATLEAEAAVRDANKPYSPPTLGELLSLTEPDTTVDEAELVSPNEEAQRLQREGVLSPSDPTPLTEIEQEKKEKDAPYIVLPIRRPAQASTATVWLPAPE